MSALSELHPAYVLHYRRYRDTSLILDLFTRDFGKYSAVARGAQGARSRMRGMLQPFVPLLISCVGRGELKTVAKVDFHRQPVPLKGDDLLVGLYVNELINRLLGRYDPMEELFARYEELLMEVACSDDVEPLLRRFEIALLSQLGYAISFDVESLSGRPILSGCRYRYRAGEGFARVAEEDPEAGTFSGADLAAIDAGDFSTAQVLAAAKRVIRLAIEPLLEGRPLNSRLLFTGRSRSSD